MDEVTKQDRIDELTLSGQASDTEIERLNAEAIETGKLTDARLLVQTDIVKELRDQRTKNDHDRRVFKILMSFLIGIAGLAVVGVALIFLLTFQLRDIASTNQKTLMASQNTYNIILGCTQPGHPCYEQAHTQENQQITDALNSISADLNAQLSIQNSKVQADLQKLLNAINAGRPVITFTTPTTVKPATPAKVPPTTTTTTIPQRAPPPGQVAKCGALGLGVTILGKCVL